MCVRGTTHVLSDTDQRRRCRPDTWMHDLAATGARGRLALWRSDRVACRSSEVSPRRARLVLKWVTVFGWAACKDVLVPRVFPLE